MPVPRISRKRWGLPVSRMTGAALAAQHDPAARDAQRSGDLVFAGRQHHRARCVVQCRLDARRVVAGRGCEPLGRGGRRQFHTARAISRRGEIHDAVSAGIVPVVQAMVRAPEGPLANRLRMQCARGEHPENNLHNLSLASARLSDTELVRASRETAPGYDSRHQI